MYVEEMDLDEAKFFNLLLPFKLRDIQIFLQIKKHLEINGSSVDEFEKFFEIFCIDGDYIKRRTSVRDNKIWSETC